MQIGPSDTFIALKAIGLADDLTGTEKRVGVALTDHFNRKTGQCDPSLASIARLLGVSRRTVIRAIGVLVQNGYFRKTRHGGKFHRNSYEPVWSRFRANETKWNALRTAASRRHVAAELSPLQRRGCHLDGATDGTQTYSKNHLNKTLVAVGSEKKTLTSKESVVREGLSREVKSKAVYWVAEERFHVKPASSAVAARDAAERRWNDRLTKQFVAAPDIFGSLVDAIDADLHNATTDIELKKPGTGIYFLMSELDRRSPLGFDRSVATHDRSSLPTVGLNAKDTSAPAMNCQSEGGVTPKLWRGRGRTGRLGTHFFTQNSANIFLEAHRDGRQIEENEPKR